MWNRLLELLSHLDLKTQNRFAQWQARYGRRNAVLALTLTGAGLGGTATFYVYLVIAFILSLQIRSHDPVLVILFLALYVVIGTVQGVWLGAWCGAGVAFRAQRKRLQAGIACWAGSLPYLLLVIGAYFPLGGGKDTVLILLFLCGLPVLWAVVLVFAGARLMCRR